MVLSQPSSSPDLCRMGLLRFPPYTLSRSPSSNETSFHKYNNHRHVPLPLVLNANSYNLHFQFYEPSRTPNPTVVPTVKQWLRNKVKKNREVSAGANAYDNHNQHTRTKTHQHQQHNVFSWKDMIRDYVRNRYWDKALRLYYQMQRTGIKPDKLVFMSVINACGSLSDLKVARKIHEDIMARGFEADVFLGTALASMYVKCGNLESAYQVFDRITQRDVVSWNAMIAAYSQNGHPYEALAFFNEMQVQGIKPNSSTMVSILPVCADLLALEQGKQIHSYVIRSGFESHVAIATGILDMYAKCGHIGIAQQVFNKMSRRYVVSWNAMILGYGIHGHGKDAIALFSQMQRTGTKPNHSTLVGVLTACSHAGLVDEGKHYFECMKLEYGLAPKLEHYTCLVDLLGRAGHLNEAHDIIKKMPSDPDAVVWGALLGACRMHGNIELGEQAAKHLFELEPNVAGSYVQLSNIYAEAGRWEDVTKLWTMMKEGEVKKQPGCSFIEVSREVHTFLVGDRTHPQSEKLYATLETLYGKIKEAGYVPNTNLVLHDVKKEVKENMLFSHSEKLAIAFGVINTSPGTPIHIMKNLRVCSDCHNAAKFISKIIGREIIVRDANRFHRFKDGLCSCGDYW